MQLRTAAQPNAYCLSGADTLSVNKSGNLVAPLIQLAVADVFRSKNEGGLIGKRPGGSLVKCGNGFRSAVFRVDGSL